MPTIPTITLTSKDCLLLEAMIAHWHGAPHVLPALRRKLADAVIVLRQDVEPDVATTGSRVSFSVDGGPLQERRLVHREEAVMRGGTLSIGTPRGLALLGLAEGDAVDVGLEDGRSERITLHRVLFQPEAARGGRPAAPQSVVPLQRRRPAPALAGIGDDPGPEAA